MPTDTAMDILNAYRVKKNQNPAADQGTLFKYILWDRFAGKMVTDAELAEMVAASRTLSALALAVLLKEKPAMEDDRLRRSAQEAIRRFYSMNFPDGL